MCATVVSSGAFSERRLTPVHAHSPAEHPHGALHRDELERATQDKRAEAAAARAFKTHGTRPSASEDGGDEDDAHGGSRSAKKKRLQAERATVKKAAAESDSESEPDSDSDDWFNSFRRSGPRFQHMALREPWGTHDDDRRGRSR